MPRDVMCAAGDVSEAKSVRTFRGLIFDMDGVLWRGNAPLPGMHELFAWLNARNLPYVLATNNSTTSPQEYAAKLTRLGVTGVPPERIVTSSTVTGAYLRDHYPAETRTFVLGEDGLREAVLKAGMTLVEAEAQVVISGLDKQLTYSRLSAAARQIRGGATFIGTNPDRTFPAADGLVPGAGSILAALIAATDVQPIIMGKPGAPMFHEALRRLAAAPEATLMVGDRLDTDIAGAQALGLHTALLLTGVTTREALADSAVQPDAVFDDLFALLNTLQ